MTTFVISKISDAWYDTGEAPVKNAMKEEALNLAPENRKDYFKEHFPGYVWTVELNSLEDLLEFQKENGSSIQISSGFFTIPEIELLDR